MLHLLPNRWRDWVPADCPGCGLRQRGQGLCAACLGRLRLDAARPRCRRCAHPLVDGGCPDCGAGAPAYDRVVAAFDYEGLGRELIRDYKVRHRVSLARLLADLLARSVCAAGPSAGTMPDWVVPVPARREALRRRGFSPPAEMGRLLARQLGLRYRLDGVRRVHEGPRQAGLERARRLWAQEGVFAVGEAGRRQAAGRRIAVVDDVLTTGATLQAVAAALKDAGAVHVEGWVLARAMAGPGVTPERPASARALQ
ncbi:ComF family protein [Castellaniella ginsengisoli]|uniref:Phosphoribosyltransferase family protein n=1 Tax=Castellaniella ginsengisoli TaxID=546114 RepID=A0AB39FQX5_9BURK